MNKTIFVILMTIIILIITGCQSRSNTIEIPIDVLRDKIAGGWAGKMIGVSYGAKSEFRARGTTFEKELPWEPGMVENSLGQDDMYVQMSFMMTMDKYGMDAPADKFAESFANAGYRLWCANVHRHAKIIGMASCRLYQARLSIIFGPTPSISKSKPITLVS